MDSLSGKRIAVIGAGYVGGAFARRALAAGANVSALTRNPDTAAALRAFGCETVAVADISDENWHAQLAGPFDCIVNAVSSSAPTLDGYHRSYVAGLRSVGRWLQTQPRGGTILYTGSTRVYPQGDGARVHETAPVAPADSTSFAGLLVTAEKTLATHAESHGWRWFVLRLAGIYGPGRHSLLDALRSGAKEIPAGVPDGRLNLIHRDDICSAIAVCLCASRENPSGIFNLADGAPASRPEIIAWLCNELKIPQPPLVENPPGRRTPNRIIVAEKIRHALGWTPRFPSFRDGYTEILRGET